MSLEDDIRILSGVALFEELSNEQLRLLAFGAERITLAKGRELFREGDMADCGFIVVSGSIDLVRDTAAGRRVLKKVVPPMVLGELAMITETSRMTGAVASESGQVIRINRSLFRRMLEEYPETAYMLHERMTGQLRDLLKRIGELESRFGEP